MCVCVCVCVCVSVCVCVGGGGGVPACVGRWEGVGMLFCLLFFHTF